MAKVLIKALLCFGTNIKWVLFLLRNIEEINNGNKTFKAINYSYSIYYFCSMLRIKDYLVNFSRKAYFFHKYCIER